jgi:hypothetical protein
MSFFFVARPIRFHEPPTVNEPKRHTIAQGKVEKLDCECFFGNWREARVCKKHLKVGYGRFYVPV